MSFTSFEDLLQSQTKLTPMMAQYAEIKKEYRDMFLLFRMGDFYEVFFDDAVHVSKLLNIALTHRGKIEEKSIPMAGIPHHSASNYIDRLTSQGYKVAICEQVEDPKEAVGIVKRAVTQIVSPGIPYDLDKTAERESHFITATYKEDEDYYIVALDFTTGDFQGFSYKNENDFLDGLQKIAPKELISFMGQWDETDLHESIEKIIDSYKILRTYISSEYFELKNNQFYLNKIIPNFKRDKVIGKNIDLLNALGALSYYIASTQDNNDLFHISPFKMIFNDSHLKVSTSTLRGLEILPRMGGAYKDSLLGFIDKTQSSMGTRKLKDIITKPLSNLAEIEKRQDYIKYYTKNLEKLEYTRNSLGDLRDINRILAKVSTGKANAGDLLNLARATGILKDLKNELKKLPKGILNRITAKDLEVLEELSKNIEEALNDEVGASLEKGNLIKAGYSKKRDRLYKLTRGSNQELEKLEEKYRKQTGIAKLRVKSNNVAGYFIEVSKSHTNKVPNKFVRRQTLVNSERYMTDELSVLEKEMISSKEKLERLERELFKELVQKVSKISSLYLKLADVFSTLDCFQSLSWVSRQENFICPKLSESEQLIELKGAWHPLIKANLNELFIPHNLTLNSKSYLGLITGPNMAGKTTVMREAAIIQLLAQIGSYVPAAKAELGICDYLFSRLGASDDILKGQSTFMVEMSETAEILRHATNKSLIILDEVGRGTSTYDGLSIAWALVEHIHDSVKALTLFATHYHELISVVENLTHAKNFTVETKNKNGQVQFLYNLIEKGASQSFGLHVAKLAGLPKSLTYRAQNLLKELESEQEKFDNQLEIFQNEVQEEPNLIEKELIELDILNMTPVEALKKLDRLVSQAKSH